MNVQKCALAAILLAATAAILAGPVLPPPPSGSSIKTTPAITPGQTAKPSDSNGPIVKFVGTDKGSLGGRPTMKLNVEMAATGEAKSFLVAKMNSLSNAYDPAAAVTQALDKLGPGDLVRLTLTPQAGQMVVSLITPYRCKPNEDEPGEYIYTGFEIQKVERSDYMAVKLERFGTPRVVYVPNIKDPAGNTIRDSNLADAVMKIAAGTVVELDSEKLHTLDLLQSIRPYGQAVDAVFVKYFGELVTLKRLGHEIVIRVPIVKQAGRSMPDPQLLAPLRTLKYGQAVTYKILHVGDKTYLSEITPGPTPDAPTKPATP